MSLLNDEKPITIRIAITCLTEILKIKPHPAPRVSEALDKIDFSKYKESMSHLIEKDISIIRKQIG